MKKPVTRPPKPPRRARLIRPTLAEDIAIMRGIAADPDNPESKKADFRRARPLSELIECRTRMAAKRAKQAMTETRKGSWAKPYDAANYLKTEETMWLYLANAQADGDPHLIEMAESAIERARVRIASNVERPDDLELPRGRIPAGRRALARRA